MTAVRADATAVLASEANKGMARLPHIELADSIPKKPAVKNFYAVWPKFVAIDLWRSGPNWTATMDQSHSAADMLEHRNVIDVILAGEEPAVGIVFPDALHS